jgi:predicted PurR-regulated permease PerM
MGGTTGETDPRPAEDPSRSAGRDTTVLRIEIAGKTMWQVVGVILATLVLLGMASAARGLMSMLALSFFFSLALDPAVRWLRGRYGWRRGAAVGVIYVAGIAFVVFLVFVLVPAIQTLADTISTSGEEWLARLNQWTNDTFGFPATSDAVAADAPQVGDALGDFSEGAFGAVVGIASAGVGLLFQTATIAMFTFYLTADAPRVQRAVLRLFSPAAQERIGWTWDQAIVQTGGYFYSRLILMVINGVGFFATMAIVGVPIVLALSLALFGGFVSVFIPAVGTYIGAAIPILVTLALAGLVPALVVLAYAVVYQQIENYWLSPKISENTMSLNGGVAFGAALAGGAIAGPMGAFVALPVAALISSVVSNYARSHDVVYRSAFVEVAEPPTGTEPSARVGGDPSARGGRAARRRSSRTPG